MYQTLFSPITINKLEIKNRIVYPALGLLFTYDGKINERYYDFFREKARGGAGIVTVGPIGIDFLGAGPIVLDLSKDEAIPSFSKMSSIIKEEGARPWLQLFHAGAYSHPMMINNKTPIAPSAEYSKYSKTTPREMTIDEIEEVQRAFANAANRAKQAGFDGVEIIMSAGYLVTQFLSPLKNRRTDEYGGSFENRVRFPREVIERSRELLGPDFPLSVRVAGNDFVPGSNTDRETPEFAKVYEKAGVNLINVTGGWHETHVPQMTSDVPRNGFSFLASAVKRAVSIPVIASNRITTPDDAERLLRDSCADMVCIGRPLIADPYWPKKAKEGVSDEIRPCVACLQGCMGEVMSGRPASCIVNPLAGFENVRHITKSDSPKNVMVVGAGVGGLEAAITARRVGHSVSLYEKGDDIGGQLPIAAAPPHKEELLELLRYYRRMIEKYEIPVFLKSEMTVETITEKSPDYVIIAEGAEPLVPPISGVEDSSVISSWEVLKTNPKLGKKVAVIGGGAVGLETALYVAKKGTLSPEALHFLFAYEAEDNERLRELVFSGTSAVTVFEMLPKMGQDVGRATRWVLMANLDRFGVTLNTEAKVLSIKEGVLTYERNGEEVREEFDQVILAAGSRSVNRLATAMEHQKIPFKTVGDCVEPGKINHAVHGGFLAAIEI